MENKGECDEECTCALCEARNLTCEFSYIFYMHGMGDLKIKVTKQGAIFRRDDECLPFPKIGFLTDNEETDRFEVNQRRMNKFSASAMVDASQRNMHVFLSIANSVRSWLEHDQTDLKESIKSVGVLYSDAISLSGDESGIKILKLIKSRPGKLTFCSTDDEETGLVQEDIRISVAEAFSGLAMVAAHENDMHMMVGYASAALFKHRSALPLINCARIMSVVKHGADTAAHLTHWVILPYYLRIGEIANHEKEMSIWGPKYTDIFSYLPEELVCNTNAMMHGSTGTKAVIQGKYKNYKFVRKVCVVCNKGTQETEKVKACSRCGMVYYCGKQCQIVDWKQHKLVCGMDEIRSASP